MPKLFFSTVLYLFKILIRKRRVGSDHGNSTQPWHDFTNIKAKLYSAPTDSRFRVAAPPQPLIKLSRRPTNSPPVPQPREAAKWSSRFKPGQQGAPALAAWPSPK